MTHPSVITLERSSLPRVLFCGDRLVEVELPEGTRVIYPKVPLPGLADAQASIRHALVHPEQGAPLSSRLWRGMKVTIVLAAGSGWPGALRPDPRARVLQVLLPILADSGVDDVHVVFATGLGRRLSPDEMRRIVGPVLFEDLWPAHLSCHDAEAAEELTALGEAGAGAPLDVSRRAVESDLVITVHVRNQPGGVSQELGLGLSSYRSWRATVSAALSGGAATSASPRAGTASEPPIPSSVLKVFSVEVVLSNRSFEAPLHLLTRNEDDLVSAERAWLRGLLLSGARLPQSARHALWSRCPAGSEILGVFAGEGAGPFERAQALSASQHIVPVEGASDVVVTGIPPFGPHNRGAFQNPLLVQWMALTEVFGAYRGSPLVRPGGTLILLHPCTDRFDSEQHTAYIDFVHRFLPDTRDSLSLHRRHEADHARDPALIEMYRRGHAYHPAHPFMTWYSGDAARQHLGRVIVVGADNEYIPKLLGFETAASLAEALYLARGGEMRRLSVTCLHAPPVAVTDVRPLGGHA